MPKITDYTGLTTPADDDVLIIEDTSTASTKKITRADLFKTPPIPNATVTPNILATGATAAYTATAGTTSSTSWTTTLTSGGTNPSVTVTIGANGLALVSIYSTMAHSVSNALMGFTFGYSGANTYTPNEASGGSPYAIRDLNVLTGITKRNGNTVLLTGLNAGSTTFTMYYYAASATGTFSDRRISVIPL